MNTGTKKNIRFQTAQYQFNLNNPHKTFELCQEALDPLKTILTTEEETKWNKLRQDAEKAISEKRKTNSSYASHITLSVVETPIDQRTIKHETVISSSQCDPTTLQSESSANTNKATASEEIVNNALWAMCTRHIKYDKLDQIDNLCTRQLQLIHTDALNKDQTPSSQNLLLQKHLASLQNWLNLIHQNSHNQASLFAQNELEQIKKDNTSNKSQQDLWLEICQYTADIIKASNILMDKFLNPKPQKSINWDRFSQTPFLSHFRFINRDIYPDLYEIALKGRDQVNYEMKRRVISSICITAVLAFATSVTLYLNDYTSSLESKLIAISVFICGLLITLSYTAVAATLTEETIIENIRYKHKLAAKQK